MRPRRRGSQRLKGASLDTYLLILDETASIPDSSSSRKRPTDKPPTESSRQIAKVRHRSTPGGTGGQIAEKRLAQPQTNENEQQKTAYLQVGRYLLPNIRPRLSFPRNHWPRRS